MGWLYELAASLMILLTPKLHDLGLHNLYYPGIIVMFLVIPLIHLMNDDDTKDIISQEGWYQGLKYMMGIHGKQSKNI